MHLRWEICNIGLMSWIETAEKLKKMKMRVFYNFQRFHAAAAFLLNYEAAFLLRRALI
jgi:hypothetical protein